MLILFFIDFGILKICYKHFNILWIKSANTLLEDDACVEVHFSSRRISNFIVFHIFSWYRSFINYIDFSLVMKNYLHSFNLKNIKLALGHHFLGDPLSLIKKQH